MTLVAVIDRTAQESRMSRFRSRPLATTLAGLAAAVSVANLTACQSGAVLAASTASPTTPATTPSEATTAATSSDTSGSAAAAIEPAQAAVTISPTATTPSPASPGTADAQKNRCSVPLPDDVIGEPTITPGDVDGVWTWHDGHGWHLRITHPGKNPEVFTGSVRSAQTITAVPYVLEKGDSFHLSADRHVLTFTVTNYGRIDGLDITDQCAIATQFGFQYGGAELPANAVHLGARGTAPATDPFTIRRKG